MKIAVVDDSKFTRMVIKQILNELSNTDFCWEAENGKVALEKNTRDPVDLIISDLEMPVLDGLQLLKTVIGRGPKTKCLLISAFHKSNQPKIIDALKAGAIGFIEKNSLGKGFDINSLKKELFNLKIMKKSGQLTDTSQFKKVRKQIASLLTKERLEKNA